MPWFGMLSYGLVAVLYGVTGVIVVASHPGSRHASASAAAIIVSSVWGAGLAVAAYHGSRSGFVPIGLDALHLLGWTACVLSWLSPPSARRGLLATSATVGLAVVIVSWPARPLETLAWAAYPALVVMALLGFLAVEQVYRNAETDARRQVRLLCIAAGAIFAVDLFTHSQAALFGTLQPVFWDGRGLANAALLPLLVLGIKRQSEWQRELFVSRQVAFYTASLLGVGGYLLAMGVVAYILRALGREWSVPIDLLFLAAAMVVLVVVLFSVGIRTRFKVLLVKHFYRNKYDYREQWLRLTQTLGQPGDLQQTALTGLQGMARIIDSQAGDLWVERDDDRYEWLVSLGRPSAPVGRFDGTHAVVKFLESTGWVVDTDEYAREPDRYGTAFGHPADGVLPRATIVVPLNRQGHLQGFVALDKPPGLSALNFEDHDILKTAGRQVAAVLAQALVQEQLAETRQFEALNRLAAFLMHDLKNIVAQQELVVANARRLKHRADFLEDAFTTIHSGTERIKRVLGHLASASRTRPEPGRVDVRKVLMEVRSQCSARSPIPEIESSDDAVLVRMDRDEITNLLLHLVRNAQEATPADGSIKIGVTNGGSEVVISVSDTGCGMAPAFVRDRLFRPFDSTKGAGGMGIGVYQARHLVRLAGGDLEVSTEVGAGTTFTIRLPSSA